MQALGRIGSSSSLRVRRPGTATFAMAAVLLIFGFFTAWPVILVLMNSFNTATDWFVEPRSWGLAHWGAAFSNPKLFIALAQLPVDLGLDGRNQLPDWHCHCMDSRPNEGSLQPRARIHVLGRLHGARPTGGR